MSFGWTKEKHGNALLHWAGSVTHDIRNVHEALASDNCSWAASSLRRGFKHWGRAKAHEDALALGAKRLPSSRLRAELDRLKWHETLQELENLETEVGVECERSERVRGGIF